jgi:probable inorganic polyphosphate/ATP-NAD kinase
VIEILITKSGDARAHFDGQSHIDVQNFDRIIIRRYHNPLRVLHPTDYQYFKTLRQKLHWGEQLI